MYEGNSSFVLVDFELVNCASEISQSTDYYRGKMSREIFLVSLRFTRYCNFLTFLMINSFRDFSFRLVDLYQRE